MSHTASSPGGALPSSFALPGGRTCELRGLVEDDAEACCALLPRLHAETDFLNWVAGEFALTIEQEREFIRGRADPSKGVTVAAVVDRAIVGLAGATRPEFKKFRHHAELGICVLRDYWGMGIGDRMMRIIVDWGAAQRLHKMYLRVFADNERAHRWYERLGFVDEARLKDDVLRADGTYGDAIVMARYYK